MANLSLLLVDDELPLLGLLRKYLERQGYTVDVCETGQAAIEKCRQTPIPFHLVVLDLKLPDMPGEAVMEVLLRESNTVRVLISSGTPFSNEVVDKALRPRVGSLLKPFVPKQLLEAIAELVPSSRAAGTG
ncbi:response regulator [uncultured Paludibaculum sp.]|uniref:response regulator n=1 Tax=uncultured Paludibaculum sp. TaxID=1765020 RepID=UPI002AABE7D6|nr:response regulator [uncultured Paludibaculum sp.]